MPVHSVQRKVRSSPGQIVNAFDLNMPEVGKKTVSLWFANSVDVDELMIGTLHPWQQPQ